MTNIEIDHEGHIGFEHKGETVYFAHVRYNGRGAYAVVAPDRYIRDVITFDLREDAIAHAAQLARDWMATN